MFTLTESARNSIVCATTRTSNHSCLCCVRNRSTYGVTCIRVGRSCGRKYNLSCVFIDIGILQEALLDHPFNVILNNIIFEIISSIKQLTKITMGYNRNILIF